MFNYFLPILIAFLMAFSVLLLFWGGRGIALSIPKPERDYMDPLPLPMRLLWPFVLFFSYYVGERLSVEYIEKIRLRLKRAGLGYLLTPEQFFGFKLTVALMTMLIGWYSLSLIDAQTFTLVSFLGGVGFLLPELNIYERKKKINKEIVRALPVYMDYLTMSVEAGLNLSNAIMQAAAKGPKGSLNNELQLVIRDIKSGVGKIEALKKMSDRLDISDITNLVAALAHADKSGAMIGKTLRIQAEQKRVERFQRAEKMAMQAPVKLVGPLVLFIFPITFIIIFFPIVTQLMGVL